MTPLNKLAQEIHDNAIEKGWWENERNFGELIALMHSELSEALESWRKHEPAQWRDPSEVSHPYYGPCDAFMDGECLECYKKQKPEGWGVELADALIRILDCMAANGLDIDEIVEDKIKFNKTRTWRHGGLRA